MKTLQPLFVVFSFVLLTPVAAEEMPTDPHECYLLGKKYAEGDGVEKDMEKANALFRQAAEQDDSHGIHALGISYYGGEGVPKNVALAFTLFRRAAEMGNEKSQCCLAILPDEKGQNILDDPTDERLMWLEKAADKNDDQALRVLGMLYLKGFHVKMDIDKGRELLRRAAEEGDVQAQFLLASIGVENTRHLVEDSEERLKWLHKAAEGGYAKAQYMLGSLQDENGQYVLDNPAERLMWLRKAAESEQAETNDGVYYAFESTSDVDQSVRITRKDEENFQATITLAIAYDDGNGWFEPDPQERHRVQNLALSLGLAEGLRGCVASQLQTRLGVVNDVTRELFYVLRRAADDGNILSISNMGVCLLSGTGIECNQVEGLRMLRLAAEKNDSYACYTLGNFYLQGFTAPDGTELLPHDEARAIALLEKAGEQGHEESIGTLYGIYYHHLQKNEQDTKTQERFIYWLEKHAAMGNAQSQGTLAELYFQGRYTPANPSKALYWAEEGAKQNNRQALFIMGCLSFAHEEIARSLEIPDDFVREKDDEKAIEYLKKAADQKYPYAAQLLARYYAHIDDSFNWFIWLGTGAELGCKDCQRVFGMLCLSNKDGLKDRKAGIEYLKKAADQGDIMASIELQRIENETDGKSKADSSSGSHDSSLFKKLSISGMEKQE